MEEGVFGPLEWPADHNSAEVVESCGSGDGCRLQLAENSDGAEITLTILTFAGLEIVLKQGRGTIVGTGCVVSGSAITFLQFLHDQSIAGDVLELGSGTGAVSIGLAAHGCRMVATDVATNPHSCSAAAVAEAVGPQENYDTPEQQHLSGDFVDLLQVIRCNAGMNDAVIRNAGGELSVAPLLWGDRGQLDEILQRHSNGFDYVLACNVTYQTQAYSALVETIVALSCGRTRIFIATTRNLGDNRQLALAAQEAGLCMRQVFEEPKTYTLIFELSFET